MTGKLLVFMLALLSLFHLGVAESSLASSPFPSPPEIWKAYDPDAEDFKEEIVSERTEDGIYYRELRNEETCLCK